jgi:5-methylcytosine-specific restriction endonuclease McrA
MPKRTKHSINQIAYQWYLTSPAWRDRRTAAFRKAQGRCQKCGGPATEVHHKTYARIFAELPSDLLVVCRRCHEDIHHKLKLSHANDNDPDGGAPMFDFMYED